MMNTGAMDKVLLSLIERSKVLIEQSATVIERYNQGAEDFKALKWLSKSEVVESVSENPD